jgi:cell division septum initiation protein DivIVA
MVDAQPIRIPMEISRPPAVFDVVVRGYDRRQVQEYLSGLEQELAELAWQRDVLDAERQQVRAAREELVAERASWEEEKAGWQPSFAALGERVSEILTTAQQEAEQLRTRTKRECEEGRRTVEQEIGKTREELAAQSVQQKAELRRDLDLARREAEAEAAQILHNARSEAESLVQAARHEADGIRIRAREILAAARQERTKAALQLAEVAERINSAHQFLADAAESADGSAPPRIVVHIDAMDDPG